MFIGLPVVEEKLNGTDTMFKEVMAKTDERLKFTGKRIQINLRRINKNKIYIIAKLFKPTMKKS